MLECYIELIGFVGILGLVYFSARNSYMLEKKDKKPYRIADS
jgi:hypothetical protein